MRPYTRSLHPNDYNFLGHVPSLRAFERSMVLEGVPHREWHEHRLWEYASIMQQLEELHVAPDAKMLDVGSGASFFPPYLATCFPFADIELTDSMKYGDIRAMVQAQRDRYTIDLPLHDMLVEDMAEFEADYWDVVMCISTIEHVDADKHDDALREIWRITKPGGYIFITSDYFRDYPQYEASPSRHLQFTPYMKEFVLQIPNIIDAWFVPNAAGVEDLEYRGDFVHSYSFCNIALQKRS